MNFSTYLTRANFKNILLHNNIENIDQVWREQNKKIEAENFYIPLFAFLEAKRAAQGLSKIQYSEGHLTIFSDVWNKFVENEKTDSTHISNMFYQVLSNATFNYEKKPITEEFIDIRYEKLVDSITKGNFKHTDLSQDGCQCQDCGQKFKISFNEWAPSFNVFEKKADRTLDYRSLVAPESCLANNIEEVKVSFPTGELIVADWIRIEKFTKEVEYQGKDKWSDEKSLNFATGRIFMTKFYAQEHNFVHVSIGNSSPNVFQNGDLLVVGNLAYNEEKDNYEEVNPDS